MDEGVQVLNTVLYALVIVHFRQPNLYSLGDTTEKFKPAQLNESLPYPTRIVPPSYPPDALGQGSVVLRVKISEEGRVTEVQVVKGMGVLTNASTEAVRKWEFIPAKNEQGIDSSSHAYAVFVYRFPLTTPSVEP